MRKNLEKIEGKRKRFCGTFERCGSKRGWKGEKIITILIKDIVDMSTKQKVAKHIWFSLTKGFQVIRVKKGDIIEFDARVKEYIKGYRGYNVDVYKPIEKDYRLSHPTKIKVI